MSNDIIVFLVVLGVIIGLFFLLRELNCWYWKINERIFLQKQQNWYLKQLLAKFSTPEEVKNQGVTEKDNKG